MTTETEMTLDQWTERLPEFHRARKELAALRAQVATLVEAVREMIAYNGQSCLCAALHDKMCVYCKMRATLKAVGVEE